MCEPDLQSCTVAKRNKKEAIWQATGQSNLANRMEDCSSNQSAVVENKHQTLEAFVAASHLCTKFDCLK